MPFYTCVLLNLSLFGSVDEYASNREKCKVEVHALQEWKGADQSNIETSRRVPCARFGASPQGGPTISSGPENEGMRSSHPAIDKPE